MLILIRGRNNSGKSACAEKLAASLNANRYYLAAMIPYGEDGRARVHRHRAQRAALDFTTLELPHKVGDAKIPYDCAVLVEDASNLLSNVLFDRGGDENAVLDDLLTLCRKVKDVVLVTISEWDDGAYDEGTRNYIAALNSLNRRLADESDVVMEMRNGKPIMVKGASHV